MPHTPAIARLSTLPTCALLALLTACSGEPDDGVILVPPDPNFVEPEPTVFEAPPPVEVALPAPPDLGPLEGWKPPEDCAPGKMPVIGESACQWIGTPCPADSDTNLTWPTELPEGDLRYVTPGGTGDGLTPGSAMGSIQQAVDEVPAGGTVVLSTGRFVENVTIDRPVSLQGVCARDTVIEAASPMPEQVIEQDVNNAPIMDASFRREAAVLRITENHTRAVRDLQVTGERIGVLVEQGEIDLQGLWLADTKLFGLSGYAETGTLTIRADGLAATDVHGSEAHAPAPILGLPSETYGHGIMLNEVMDATTEFQSTLERIWTHRTDGSGAFLAGSRDATRAHAQHTLRQVVSEGASQANAISTTVRFQRTSGVVDWLYARHANSLSGVAIDLSEVTGSKLVIEDARSVSGLHVRDEGRAGARARVALSDVLIRNIAAPLSIQGALALADVEFGYGVMVFGGMLELHRAEIDRATSAGVFAVESQFFCTEADIHSCGGSELRVEDLKVTATRPDSRGRHGMGLVSADGASLTASRILADENHSAGILVVNNLLDIDGTESGESRAILSDVTVTATQHSLGIEDIEFGDGIAVVNGAATQVERFEVHDNARVGLLVGGTSEFRQSGAFFKDGQVTGHVIGVSVASGWMDLDRDFDNVSSFDNQVNLSSTEMKMPSMSLLP